MPHRLTTLLVLLAFPFAACRDTPPVPPDAVSLRDDVYVQPLAPDVWRHVSFRWFPGAGPFPSNGLVVRGEDDVVLLVDTAWNDEQTEAVLDWAEQHVGSLAAVVVTHAHDDRMGGLVAVHRRGIPSVGLFRTADLAAVRELPPLAQPVLSEFRLDALGVKGEIFFPGAGHTADNAVVYLEDPKLLAGSCLVRSAAAESLGNLDDADVAAWPDSVRALQARYPDAERVVPGHGEPGGPELLSHTLHLLTPDGG